MGARLPTGPELPTYWERLLGKLRLPYNVGALLLAAWLGLLGRFVVQYIQSRDPYQALANPFVPPSPAFPLWRSVLSDLVLVGILFAALVMIRHMRTKVVRAEPDLRPLVPGGEAALHRAFSGVSRTGPPIALAVLIVGGVFGLPGFLSTGPPPPAAPVAGPETHPVQTGLLLLSLALIAAFIWVYYSAIRGLHRLGREVLQLRPFHEDPLLGARPLGALSLALAVGYFVPVALMAASFLIDVESSPPLVAFVALLIPLGVVLFFQPLRHIHEQMLHAKQTAQAALRQQFAQLLSGGRNPSPDPNATTLTDVKQILLWDVAQRQVAAIPTWPFDTRILSRFAAIILSVIAILLARLVTVAFRL